MPRKQSSAHNVPRSQNKVTKSKRTRSNKKFSSNVAQNTGKNVSPQLSVKVAPTQKNSNLTKAVQAIAVSAGAKLERISVVINPVHLHSFFVGYFGSQITRGDSIAELQALAKICMESVRLVAQEDVSIPEIPMCVAEIRNALRSRRSGNTVLEADFSACLNLPSYFANLPFYDSATTMQFPEVAGTTKYYTSFTDTVPVVDSVALKTLLANYFPNVPLVSYDYSTIKEDDFSGFAIDSLTPRQLAVSSVTTADYGHIFVSGAESTPLTHYWSNETSTVFCEGPMYTKWLASLRLGTPTVNGNGSTATITGNSRRRPGVGQKCILSVVGSPAALGHAKGLKIKPVNVQLKIVPATSAVQDICNRIEAAINALPSATKTVVLGLMSTGDFQSFVGSIFVASISKNGYASYGSAYCQGSPYTGLAVPAFHVGMNSIFLSQVPESVSRCLCAILPYKDGDSYLVPSFAASGVYTPCLPTLAWSGTGTSSPPYGTGTNGPFMRYGNTDIVAKWKLIEPYLTTVVSLRPLTNLGETLLDVTIVRSSANIVLGIYSKLPITQRRRALILGMIQWISYENIKDNGYGITKNNVGPGNHSHQYRQSYFETSNGMESVADIAALGKLYGIIAPGALPSQNPIPSDDVEKEFHNMRPSPPVGFLEAARNFLVPRFGNYGGPSWTAGKDVSDGSNPEMKMGKHGKYEYVVPPVNDEDACYKRHDEAYFYADRGQGTREAADIRLSEELGKLKDVSTYGTAAKHYFYGSKAYGEREL